MHCQVPAIVAVSLLIASVDSAIAHGGLPKGDSLEVIARMN
jgi:hypothetical protein